MQTFCRITKTQLLSHCSKVVKVRYSIFYIIGNTYLI